MVCEKVQDDNICAKKGRRRIKVMENLDGKMQRGEGGFICREHKDTEASQLSDSEV